jgi:hypothetical protein
MSDEITIPGRADNADRFRQVLVAHGGPAFLRRATEVAAAYEQLLDSCRKQRQEWLGMVKVRLALLHALAGTWEALGDLLEDETQLVHLKNLHAELIPRLRVETPSPRRGPALERALAQLVESIENFNRRWTTYIQSINLSPINKLRDGYNRHYLLEKECAVRSSTVARQGFRPLAMLDCQQIETILPPLSVPRLKRAP